MQVRSVKMLLTPQLPLRMRHGEQGAERDPCHEETWGLAKNMGLCLGAKKAGLSCPASSDGRERSSWLTRSPFHRQVDNTHLEFSLFHWAFISSRMIYTIPNFLQISLPG